MSSVLQFFVLVYITYWVCALVGVIVVRSDTSVGRRLEIYTWNSRVEMWHRLPQFRLLFGAMEDGRIVASSLLVMAFNLPMVILQCVAGIALLSPVLAMASGGFAGVIIGQGRGRRFFVYAAATAIVEFGAFASAGALGMTVGAAWLLHGSEFSDAVTMVVSNAGAYTLLPLVFLAANGVLEASGPCYWGIDGVPGIRAYRNRTLKRRAS